MHAADEIERGLAAFARSPNGGLIVTATGAASRHHDLIIALAARHKQPAVYFARHFFAGGGLVSYGPDRTGSTDGRLVTSIAFSGGESGRLAGADTDQV